MANNVVEILQGVVGELREMAKSESIIGDPITVGDRTVIPVVKLSVGFGAGGGSGEDEKKRAGYGGGGGGGASIEPAAFIIMGPDGIQLLPAKKGGLEGVIDSIPGIARKLSKLKDKFKSDKNSDNSGDSDGSDDEHEGEPPSSDK